MSGRSLACSLLLLLGWLVGAAAAQPAPAVPAPLAPWVGWALDGQEHRRCPFLLGAAPGDAAAHLCAWPGPAEIDVAGDAARFSLVWTVLAEGEVHLPGDQRLRPQDVRIDGRDAAVLMRGGRPSLRLAAGRHRIEGRLAWTQRPAQLPVPDALALLSLRVDGAEVAVPERERGMLWLGRTATEPGADTLALRVYRRLDDGVPLRLTTQLQLEVSGRAREIQLGRALPDGFVPVSVQAQLPAALAADGGLRIQLRPGTWVVSLEARALEAIDAAGPPPSEPPWPADEVWSWRADPGLRVVEASGGTPADPAQVGAPWGQPLPTMVLTRDQRISLAERSRGLDAGRAHRLSLQRELWLPFDGAGLLARDRIRGQLAQAGRLDAAAGWTLQRASDAGLDLLVTADARGRPGVELRNLRPALESTSRLEQRGRFAASGWAQDFESASASLHLPPGWRLLHAAGVDRAPQAWVARWSLLDLFLLALAALLAHRLHGSAFAALVIGYLVLGYHEAASPLWSLLGVIAASLLLDLLPAGRLRSGLTWIRRLLLALAALLALPFAAEQIKLALHPQLEHAAVEAASGYYAGGISGRGRAVLSNEADALGGEVAMEVRAAPPPPPMPMSVPAPEPQQKRVITQSINAYPEDAVLQAGPGTPDWRWERVELGFAGPLLASQSVDLWLSPPWLTRTLRVLAVGLLALVLLRLLDRRIRMPAGRLPAAAAPLLLLGLVLGGAPAPAKAAELPSPELLAELRERLLRPPPCAPDCATLDSAELILGEDQLRLALVLQAEAEVAVPLPDPGKSAVPRQATLGGAEVAVRSEQGRRWISLGRGVQRVEISWRLASVEQIDLRFPMPPGRVEVRASGWEAGGLDGTRLVGDTLQLLRLQRAEGALAASAAAPVGGAEFPPFVAVTRSLQLDLDWTVVTRVERIAPAQSGFSVSIPLLPGERVLDESLDVVDGAVRLGFAAGQREVSWRSRLPISERVELRMDSLRSASERWELAVGPYWNARLGGLPESAQAGGDGVRRFDPRPGETLAIDLSRPEAVAGASLAFDRVNLAITQGLRARDAHLIADLRSTRGGQHLVQIPEDAELIEALSRGERLNLRVEGGQVRLPVLPGHQTIELRWRRPLAIAPRAGGDAVDLGADAANLRTTLRMDGGRWLLAAGGEGVGPAVLYWAVLALMVLVALGLARLSAGTPLQFRHWLLLGLGFSTVSWLAAAVVVGWLLLLALRQRRATQIVAHTAFPLFQIGLLLASAAALLCLVAAIPYGLLGQPDMQVVGNGSSAGQLNWFSDRSEGAMPQVWALSLPLWAYKLAILAWSLWLANALIGWLRWGWQCFSAGGYWPPRKPRKEPAAAAANPAAESGAGAA